MAVHTSWLSSLDRATCEGGAARGAADGGVDGSLKVSGIGGRCCLWGCKTTLAPCIGEHVLSGLPEINQRCGVRQCSSVVFDSSEDAPAGCIVYLPAHYLLWHLQQRSQWPRRWCWQWPSQPPEWTLSRCQRNLHSPDAITTINLCHNIRFAGQRTARLSSIHRHCISCLLYGSFMLADSADFL